MATKKQERQAARRQYEKYLARQQELAKKRRRTRVIVVTCVVAALVVALGVGAFAILGSDDDPAPSASATSTPTTAAVSIGEPATDGSPCDPVSPQYVTSPANQWGTVPDAALAEGRTWQAELSTNCGTVSVDLDGAEAPQAVSSFIFLAQNAFYDNTLCHRLTTNGIFVLQCGDPTTSGSGSPGYSYGPIENAPADDAGSGAVIYPAGTIAMANSGSADSNGSQFFICYEDSTLAPSYTVLGHVTAGLDIVKTIASGGARDGSDGAPNWPIAIQGVTVQ